MQSKLAKNLGLNSVCSLRSLLFSVWLPVRAGGAGAEKMHGDSLGEESRAV